MTSDDSQSRTIQTKAYQKLSTMAARLSIAAALAATIALVVAPSTLAFAPPSSSFVQQHVITRTNTVATSMITELVTDIPSILASASTTIPAVTTDALSTLSASSSNLLSFSDQGQNLAGIFFQCSLLPYLFFLSFLSFRGNRTPDLGNFGWQFLLLFVLGTIPSGIVTRSVYADSLANVDWLHGGAEALLTITNVLIVSS